MLEIMRCVFGSHLYGLQTTNSDMDFKGIYLPTYRELLLGNFRKQISTTTGDSFSKNTKDDVDIEIFSLPYFIELACKGETVAMDMLHVKEPLISHPIWDSLVSKRKRFYTRNMSSYIGYSRKQANKYGIKGSRMGEVEIALNAVKSLSKNLSFDKRLFAVKDSLPLGQHINWTTRDDRWLPGEQQEFYEVCGRKFQSSLTLAHLQHHLEKIYADYGERAKAAKENSGVDWKAVSHALRAAYQMRAILIEGDFEYPLKETDFLRDVKCGQLDFISEVQPELDSVIEQIENLSKVSSLPEKVDRECWDNFLISSYLQFL